MIPKINLFVVCVDSFPGVPQRIPYLPFGNQSPQKKETEVSSLGYMELWNY
jgi:hypothetical protein